MLVWKTHSVLNDTKCIHIKFACVASLLVDLCRTSGIALQHLATFCGRYLCPAAYLEWLGDVELLHWYSGASGPEPFIHIEVHQ